MRFAQKKMRFAQRKMRFAQKKMRFAQSLKKDVELQVANDVESKKSGLESLRKPCLLRLFLDRF